MPQLMIDTSVETPDLLRLTADFLNLIAAHAQGIQPDLDSNHTKRATPTPPPNVDWNAVRAAGDEAGAVAEMLTAAAVPSLVPAPDAAPPPPPPPPAEELPLAASAGAPPPPPPPPDSTANLTGVNYDKDGLPWDARIHSTPAKLNADGSYRRKRGVEDAAFNAIANQIRVPAGTVPNSPVSLPASALPVREPAQPVQQQPGNVPVPPPPAAGAVPPPPNVVTLPASVQQAPAPQSGPVPPNEAQMKFRVLAQQISSALQAGKLTNDQVIQACKANGVSGLPELLQNPEAISAVALLIASYIAP